jgi:ABC-type sugar transport system permease subunit
LSRNNLIFVFAVPGILLVSLVVTVLHFEEAPGWHIFRSVYYLPTILSATVVST